MRGQRKRILKTFPVGTGSVIHRTTQLKQILQSYSQNCVPWYSKICEP